MAARPRVGISCKDGGASAGHPVMIESMSVTSVVAKARPSQLASVIVAAVELRAFAGLALDDVAQILDISQSTVWREWKTAQLWLRREMTARARIERIPRSE